MSNNTQIELVQKPIIKHTLEQIGAQVTARLDELNINNLVATEETVKALKLLSQDLNREFKEYEEQRKALKEAVASPYMEFEAVYKVEISEKYKKAVETLKDKVAIVENKVKANKKASVERYFNELCLSVNIDFLKFDNVGLDINLSTSEKQYKEKCDAFVNRVQDDVVLINTMEFPAEMMTEYKNNSFNASLAIKTVKDRKEAEKLEKERIKQAETNRRSTLLRGLSMVYHDMTKTMNYVQDENIYISMADVENLSVEDFQKNFVEIENKIIQKKQQEADLFSQQNQPVTQSTPVGETQKQAPSSSVTTKAKVSAPVSAPITSPISAPVEVEQPVKEERLSASFEVFGSMAKLMALKAFLVDNNYEYNNI